DAGGHRAEEREDELVRLGDDDRQPVAGADAARQELPAAREDFAVQRAEPDLLVAVRKDERQAMVVVGVGQRLENVEKGIQAAILPEAFNQASVGSSAARAARNETPSSRCAFDESMNQKRVAYGTTCGLKGSGIRSANARRATARMRPFGNCTIFF